MNVWFVCSKNGSEFNMAMIIHLIQLAENVKANVSHSLTPPNFLVLITYTDHDFQSSVQKWDALWLWWFPKRLPDVYYICMLCLITSSLCLCILRFAILMLTNTTVRDSLTEIMQLFFVIIIADVSKKVVNLSGNYTLSFTWWRSNNIVVTVRPVFCRDINSCSYGNVHVSRFVKVLHIVLSAMAFAACY